MVSFSGSILVRIFLIGAVTYKLNPVAYLLLEIHFLTY